MLSHLYTNLRAVLHICSQFSVKIEWKSLYSCFTNKRVQNYQYRPSLTSRYIRYSNLVLSFQYMKSIIAVTGCGPQIP